MFGSKARRCTIMDGGTMKIQNPKCRLYWCLIEFVYLLFDLPHPSPFQSQCTVYRQCVAVGGGWVGGGVLSCVVDHFYKIASPSPPAQTKTQEKTTFRDCCLYSSFVHVYNAELTQRYRSCCAWSSWLLTSTLAVLD
jgi:hypothetical protein